jgi:hypothetical protein
MLGELLKPLCRINFHDWNASFHPGPPFDPEKCDGRSRRCLRCKETQFAHPHKPYWRDVPFDYYEDRRKWAERQNLSQRDRERWLNREY